MKIRPPLRRRNTTGFVNLDTSKCKACWKCQEVCPNQVIGKIDLFFHRHSLLVQPDNCRGCLCCVAVCPEQALTGCDVQGNTKS